MGPNCRITYLDGRVVEVRVLPIDRRAYEQVHKEGYGAALEKGTVDVMYWPAWHAARRDEPTLPGFVEWVATLAQDPEGIASDEAEARPTGETSSQSSEDSPVSP